MASQPPRSGEPSNASSTHNAGATPSQPKKKKTHRGGKKRRNRRQSFAPPPDLLESGEMETEARPSLADITRDSRESSSFYRLHGNNSNTSLESEALLDHRDHGPLQTRRQSIQQAGIYGSRPSQPFLRPPYRSSPQNNYSNSRLSQQQGMSEQDDEDEYADDRTPLMSGSHHDLGATASAPTSSGKARGRTKRPQSRSSAGSRMRSPMVTSHYSLHNADDYDINNPPSVPTSPVLEASNDVMLTGDLAPSIIRRHSNKSRDLLIDIDEERPQLPESSPPSPKGFGDLRRRMTIQQAEGDVCFPMEGMSELGEQDYMHPPEAGTGRRKARRWPDFRLLERYSQQEREGRTLEGIRARKVSEPLMIDGRLRPQKQTWHKEVEDAPYRFTYFNDDLENTIHSQTLSELVQPGQTFRDLFIPEPPVLEDSSDESDEDDVPLTRGSTLTASGSTKIGNNDSLKTTDKQTSSGEQTRSTTPAQGATPTPKTKEIRYGQRPAWWLDILNPTEEEMRVIGKTFKIHALSVEDIAQQEPREKVELFRNYYFVNYRTFEQDPTSDDYLEPVNMYMVVFREGIITVHYSMSPHPNNVRRRIRQLKNFISISSDWICYGIIDDITDCYVPLISQIEEDVDDIDDAILRLHSADEEEEAKKTKWNKFTDEKASISTRPAESGRDMLRRVGECRKKVMGLYRLLSNKADVIKGFAKRCTERYDVAPGGDIGFYLGDIQDHIVTMTANLGHYENLLARAHSNYLAQINIRMNERQEKTSDILGKLTVLGTIVLPMNVVTGIWGMNCLVPGQDIENLWWFFGITSGLVLFGVGCMLIARKVYGIV